MLKKLVIVFLLLAIGISIFVFFKQPNETITIGSYEAVPTIEVDVQVMDVEVTSSPDDKIHVLLKGKKGDEEELSIDHTGAQLIVSEKNSKRNWNDFIQIGSQPMITIQLPKNLSKSVTIANQDGNSRLNGLALETVHVNSTTGKIVLQEMTVSNSELQSKDGNVTIHKSTMDNGTISTRSGNVVVGESTGATLAIQSVDGQIKITETTEQSNVKLKSKTGDIQVSYKTAPSSLRLTMTGDNINIDLLNYDKQSRQIGEGANQLSIETEDGVIQVK